ncbi:MAG: PSD1 and planctomycete cytochrome C domain-containing protein [Planctomycetota bacterium]
MHRPALRLAVAFIALLSYDAVRADDAGMEFFEKKIRPMLVEHCQKCHATDSKKVGGGLLLDHREGILTGGDSGAAIEVGKPEDSLLIKAILYDDDSLKMPPKGKLPAAVIADFQTWVKLGAPDPRDKPLQAQAGDSWAETMRQRADWWSLKPVQNPPVPQPRDAAWSANPIDRFLLARLEDAKLAPAGPADPRTLVRRISLVLTGLPPTPADVDAFAQECASTATPNQPVSAIALEKLVDSQLDSPHFGERWARHWLDIVHFTETHGNEWNYEVHHAWRYRDYLIRAFNADVPYDQFVREHIAGDLLPQPRINVRDHFNESIIGTGFYRFGEVNHDDCIGLRQIGYDLADIQIDTLTKTFQATTVACARCHNHKLDAISMLDYYGLLGVLRSSRPASHAVDLPEVNAAQRQRLGELKSELRKEVFGIWLQDASLITRYLEAAQAKHFKQPNTEQLAAGLDPLRLEKWVAVLADDKLPLEHPLAAWRTLTIAVTDPAKFADEWRKWAEQLEKEHRERTAFNEQNYVTFADFRADDVPGWQFGGQGVAGPAGRSGDFAVQPEGDSLIRTVLPAGRFTQALSDKFNGTLRSGVIPQGKSRISFQVMGQRSSAVRLVSNNCQLNYANYRALTNPELHWVTFTPPADRDSLRTYAELMTMFDNPKFPDQLSALGGDGGNYRLPWEKAAENPRSYFGVTKVVLHDVAETPKAEVSHLQRLLVGPAPQSLAELSARYAAVITTAIHTWSEDKANDDDVRWIDPLLRRDLLSNTVAQSPRSADLAKQYRQTDAELSLPRIVIGMADCGPGFDQPIFIRGDCERPGETAARRYLEVLSKPDYTFTPAGSGRLELADRIANPTNPLTARVMVNRLWHHVFGTGLVRTVDDFGHVGEVPSHPELLDYLAQRFMDDGWSVKRLLRTLLLTRTFQMTNHPSNDALEIDPQNRLLQHYPARRMEAEAVRDSILAASGRLDHGLYGMSIQPFRDKEYADRRLFPGPLDGNGRRSVYIKNNLMEGPKFLAAFNFPGGKVTQGRRDVTNVPAQALALLNDPFVLQQADFWAQKLVTRDNDSVSARIADMFQTALNRAPTADELTRFEQTVGLFAELHQVAAADVLKSQVVWKEMSHVLFNVNEFIYIP